MDGEAERTLGASRYHANPEEAAYNVLAYYSSCTTRDVSVLVFHQISPVPDFTALAIDM